MSYGSYVNRLAALFLLLLVAALGTSGRSHAVLKDLSPAQVDQAVKWGQEKNLSRFLIERAYEIGPTENGTQIRVVTKYYLVSMAAANAAYERKPLPKEEIERAAKLTELEVRVQLKYQGGGGLFDFLFPRQPTLPNIEFRLKQGSVKLEPSRIEPSFTTLLTGGTGSYRLFFPYVKLHATRTGTLTIATPEAEEVVKIEFGKMK